MITSAKNYTKINIKIRNQSHMVKTKLHKQNHTKKHMHTHSQKGKQGKKYISKKK